MKDEDNNASVRQCATDHVTTIKFGAYLISPLLFSGSLSTTMQRNPLNGRPEPEVIVNVSLPKCVITHRHIADANSVRRRSLLQQGEDGGGTLQRGTLSSQVSCEGIKRRFCCEERGHRHDCTFLLREQHCLAHHSSYSFASLKYLEHKRSVHSPNQRVTSRMHY